MFSKRVSQEKAGNLRVINGGNGKSSRGISMLGEGCSFQGKMLLDGEIRIGGKVEGNIFSHGSLIIEETACINADITGLNIQVHGTVRGNICSRDVLKLSPTARVTGNIKVSRLVVEDGARIMGQVFFVDDDQSNLDETQIRNVEMNEHEVSP